MSKTLRIAFVTIFLFQLLMTMGFELAHDEAYYWLYSRNLDWGYFDHPPFVGVIIRFFSFLPHSEFAVRVGFVILQFASLSLLLTLTGYSWIPFLLFFSFPLASLTGLLALPDIPLLFMTACYCYQLKRFLRENNFLNSILLGFIIGLLFYAKYHGELVVFFTLVALPRLILQKSFYIVALSALVTFFPHFWWQYQHDFSTLRYHFLERPSSSFSLKRIMEFLGLQMVLAGLFAGPITWWIVLKTKTAHQFDRAMKTVSIGTVVFFLISTMTKKFEANWTIFLAVPLIYLASPSPLWKKRWIKNLLLSSFVIVLLSRVLFLLPPGQLPVKRLKEFKGWETWVLEVESVCGTTSLIANSYQIASKLSFYLEREINALNYHSRKNQFDYWRFDKSLPTKEVCYITDKGDFTGIPITTPEGKKLQIVKNESLDRLWELKYSEIR
ncbi:MAG: ArnT family glycosyltransferase [Bacteriovoracia bacterium]